MSAKVGRNDPCPCGSGKKHKRCCLATQTETDLGRVRLRRAEGRLVPAIFEYVLERYGEDLVDDNRDVMAALNAVVAEGRETC